MSLPIIQDQSIFLPSTYPNEDSQVIALAKGHDSQRLISRVGSIVVFNEKNWF